MGNYFLNGLKAIPAIVPVSIYLFFQSLIAQNFGQSDAQPFK